MNSQSLFGNEESKNLDLVEAKNSSQNDSEVDVNQELALVIDKREREDAFKENVEKLVRIKNH